jgi:Uma2 family endonuclease
MIVKRNALIEELSAVPENGKAEIIDGKVVRMSPTGGRPGRASGVIFASLMQHEQTVGGGYAFPDNVGFLVDLSDRGSFSPDAAWYTGPMIDMGFVEGAPAFAVEVRSESDYGPAAERAIAQKIVDYFAAGALVVWDVDLLDADVVRKFTVDRPTTPVVFRNGDTADAEPAVPGWRMPVATLLR